MKLNRNLISLLKRFAFAKKLNARIKERQELRRWALLDKKYVQRVQAEGYVYSESDAIIAAQIRIQEKLNRQNPSYPLAVIYVGTDRNQDYSGFLQSLEKFVEVIPFFNSSGTYGQSFLDERGVKSEDSLFAARSNSEKLIADVEKLTQKYRVICIGQMLANFLDKECIQSLANLGVPVINISMDDKLSLNWSYRNGRLLGGVGLGDVVDLTLTTTPEVLDWYGVENARPVFFPLGSSKALFGQSSWDNLRDIDVLFVGNKYGIRQALIEHLEKAGVIVSAWGAGWKNGSATFEQSIALSQRAKIILGVSTVGHTKTQFTMKLRDFDGPMSGALYLTQRNFVIEKLYRESEEIELYGSYAECAKKIKKYLTSSNESKRLDIAKAGFTKAAADYEWDVRIAEMFKIAGVDPSLGAGIGNEG